MTILTRLPPELLGLAISFLAPADLERLFSLTSLFGWPPDPTFLPLQHLALHHHYSDKNLVVSTTGTPHRRGGDMSISYPELKYLARQNINIRPRQFTFVLDNNIEPVPLELVNFMMVLDDEEIMHFIYRNARHVNIDVMLNINLPSPNSSLVSHMLVCFNRNDFAKIASMKIHYYCCTCHRGRGSNLSGIYPLGMHLLTKDHKVIAIQKDSSLLYKYVQQCHHEPTNQYQFCPVCVDFQMNSLALQNFEFSNLSTYLANNPLDFSHLRTLNLSYNGINNLSSISFPESLVSLNLSNNNLMHLSSHNFKWQNLRNLRELDLSNNNLLSVNLGNYRGSEEFGLHKLRIDCNNLVDLGFLTSSPFFANVTNLDVSRNLISKLQKFPPNLVKLDLSGNYLADFFNQLGSNVFPSSLKSLNISGCKIDCGNINNPRCHHVITNWISEITELYKLQALHCREVQKRRKIAHMANRVKVN